MPRLLPAPAAAEPAAELQLCPRVRALHDAARADVARAPRLHEQARGLGTGDEGRRDRRRRRAARDHQPAFGGVEDGA